MKQHCPKRRQYNTTLAVARDKEKKYPDNVRWGRSHNDEDMITITFDDLMNIFDLDLSYSFFKIADKLYYQKIGCPMGGHLSAFYANTVCAYHEWLHTSKLEKNGIRTSAIRQMDDLVQWITYDVNDEKSFHEAVEMKDHILKTNGVYKGGLEMEEQTVRQVSKRDGNYHVHTFAGTEIWIRDKDIKAHCKTYNKNWPQIRNKGTQSLIRYPPWNSYTSRQTLRGIIIGTMYRIETQNSSINLALQSLYENYVEYLAIGYPANFYISAIRRLKNLPDINTNKTHMKVSNIVRMFLHKQKQIK